MAEKPAANIPAEIDLLVLDVDGVLTDGRITLDPQGRETKSFHVRDGAGMKYWMRAGRKLALLSGRGSPAVLRRAEELGIDLVRLSAKSKLPPLDELIAAAGTTPARTAAMGDDLTDLPVLRHVGFGVAVADAVDELRAAAAYITRQPGGGGAVREVVELLLRRAGLWETILRRYAPEAAGPSAGQPAGEDTT